MSGHVVPIRMYFLTFLLLIGLTAATVWVAFQDFGALNTPVALAIACVKGTLVVLYFMHVRHSSNLIRFFAGVSLVWLLILLVFVVAEWVSRAWEYNPQGWV